MSRLLILAAAVFFGLIRLAAADSTVSGLSTSSTSPLPAGSCFYVDQGPGTDTKLCSGYPAAIGALTAASNLSDLASAATARTNLGLGPLAVSTSISAALDTIGSTQGGVLYRGVSAWAYLSPGTSGQFLETLGASANPAWASPSGSGTVNNCSTADAVSYYAATGTAVSCLSAVGSAGQVLTSNGTGAAPTWQNSAGGTTTITTNPGLGNSASTLNGLSGSLQTITNSSNLYAQFTPVTKTANYTLNADCIASVLCDTARMVWANGSAAITFTMPNPAGTLSTYQGGDQAGKGYTVATVGGTATFNGCVTGNPTSLSVPAYTLVQLWDEGSSANSYKCALTPQVSGTNVRAVTGTTDTILSTDNGGLVTYNNSGAVAVTLPQGATAGFPANNFGLMVRNYGAGLVTITPTTSTINNGASSLALAQNQGAIIAADASGNYQVLITGQPAATLSAAGIAKLTSAPWGLSWTGGIPSADVDIGATQQAITVDYATITVTVASGVVSSVQPYYRATTVACGSGTNISSASSSLNAANNTITTLTIANAAIPANSAICLHFSGTSSTGAASATVQAHAT